MRLWLSHIDLSRAVMRTRVSRWTWQAAREQWMAVCVGVNACLHESWCVATLHLHMCDCEHLSPVQCNGLKTWNMTSYAFSWQSMSCERVWHFFPTESARQEYNKTNAHEHGIAFNKVQLTCRDLRTPPVSYRVQLRVTMAEKLCYFHKLLQHSSSDLSLVSQ